MEAIDKAVAVLQSGGVVVYPTDTAYGLAVDATNPDAVRKLYALKGRTFSKPIHVIFPSFIDLEKTVKLDTIARRLIQRLFPGPLTVVAELKSEAESFALLSAKTKTLGFRLPDHEIVKSLIKKFGRPITTTSANKSGRANCYSVLQTRKQFKGSKLKPDFYLNGGKLKKVQPSTVIAIRDHKIKLLREGPISFQQIQNLIK